LLQVKFCTKDRHRNGSVITPRRDFHLLPFCQTEGVTMTPLMSDNKMIQAHAAARNVEAGGGDN